MLKYLKKFILDIFPSVVATIVGAYIVNHYIIPSAATRNQGAATASAESGTDAKALSPQDTTATAGRESFAKGVAEKAAIEKAAEKAAEKTGDVGPVDSRRRHTPPPQRVTARTPPASDQTSGAVDPNVTEERRDANELARAAIERLRTTSEPPRTVAVAPAQQPVARDPVSAPTQAPPQQVTSATPASADVFNAGTGAVMTPARLPTPATRSAMASRPTPPADIPEAPPIDLHGEAITGRTTVAEDVMSAAKSVFHAVLPR